MKKFINIFDYITHTQITNAYITKTHVSYICESLSRDIHVNGYVVRRYPLFKAKNVQMYESRIEKGVAK